MERENRRSLNTIEIIKGDITKITNVEAIVNAANESLLGGGGVDGAIHKAAGPKLLEECKTLHGCKTGKAKITKAYKLPCEYVIHTVGPIYNGGKNQESKQLASCYLESLKLAKEKNIKSVAFPSISTGAYRYPVQEAARIALRTVGEFLNENPDMKVTFVLYDIKTQLVYATAKEQLRLS